MATKSADKPNTKVTKTIDGIKVTVDLRALGDMRFMRLMSTLFKLDKEHDEAHESGDAERYGDLTIDMMDRLDDVARLMFGRECESVQSAVAAKNDGFLSFDQWAAFISKVVEACQKNFNARPAPEHE